MRRAIKELTKDSDISLLTCSRIYKTNALLSNSPTSWNIPYFNAAIKIKTITSPEELLAKLQKIEIKLGRPKDHDKWAPRIIDLDILSCGKNIFKSNNLIIPHPLLLERSFALGPLLEIEPLWVHPQHPNKKLHDILIKLESIEILPYSLQGSKIMGVINLTPISMSGINKRRTDDELKEEIIKIVNEGAEIIDIGAESTRPSAIVLTPEMEWERLQPFLKNLKEILADPNLLIKPQISIDTYHAETVFKLKDFGIDIINDVSGIDKQQIVSLLKNTKMKYILVHNTGKAGANHMISDDEKVMPTMLSWFKQQINESIALGLRKEQIIIDPGVGFGKTKSQTLRIIKDIEQFKQLGYPILIGHSRKASALASVAHLPPSERDLETAWLSKYFSKKGIDFLRVHNVRLNRQIIDQKISVIVVHQLNNGIGFKNNLPWSLEDDKQHFRTTTLNKTVIMGRKTFESIGAPLKSRRNIILSKTIASTIEGIDVYKSLQEAFAKINPQEGIFIIGGEELYKQTIEHADYLYRTIVQANKPTDTFFPKINEKNWVLQTECTFSKGKKNEFSYTIQKLKSSQN